MMKKSKERQDSRQVRSEGCNEVILLRCDAKDANRLKVVFSWQTLIYYFNSFRQIGLPSIAILHVVDYVPS